MHPSAPDLSKYAADGHPSPIPAPGIPNHSPRQTYPSLSMSSMHAHALSVKWSTGLCHCCDDPANCLITCFCPFITFGQIAEIVSKGSQSCVGSGIRYALVGSCCLACLYSCFFRSKMRAQYDLEEAPCVDCLVHFCCPFCALCQEYRELKNHGFDMGIGWEASMDRQRRGITVAPMMGQGMTR